MVAASSLYPATVPTPFPCIQLSHISLVSCTIKLSDLHPCVAMVEDGKSRGSKFTKTELNQLCYSWMQISQDPIVGSAKKNQTFRDRVAIHYNSHRPASTQERPSIIGEQLKHDIARFSGTHATVVDLRILGSNADDTLKKAHD